MKYCYKCGNQLFDEAVLCPKCGCPQPGSRDYSSQLTKSTGANSTNDNRSIDFSSLSLYYQERFRKIQKTNEADTGGWNWCAFLFGVLWALSKGLWLSALVMTIATFATNGVLGIVVWFIYGFRGNYLYYCKYVKNEQKII